MSPSGLIPVDPRYDDLNPIRTSLRVIQPDPRVPTGFEQVYRLRTAPNARPGSPDQFARVSGALTAVFPHSEYRRTKRGVQAQIPAGTVYYIGALPGASAFNSVSPQPRPSPSGAPERIGPIVPEQARTRVAAALASPDDSSFIRQTDAHTSPPDGVSRHPAESDLTRAAQPTMLDDESFRSARLRQLLDHAMQTIKSR